ncbi:tyrosine-type recombinase/integrase [Streptomyces halobius]|uniref:Tyrosine-type recombinase/integrase n=1 Tax=Streptomyces halobius TaxID=2879846 RepID=A0ABY4M4I2_9ACTN|nr:tyrosine-type recombinase/integrase [Streptomyces halobius]UQA92674.1 tyrosine-type recombinase/integrase [Streptomyces halobius]
MDDKQDIQDLLDYWAIHLRAERKSPQTVKTYTDGVRAFLRWADLTGHAPALDRPTVNAFISCLLADGAQATTARSRQLAVRRFSAWLAKEGEIPADQLSDLKPPKLDEKVTEALTDEQCKALVAACRGPDFRDRRDEAIVRLMIETGLRAGEVVDMTLEGVDVKQGLATIVRGKGGRGRVVPFGPQTAQSLVRYLRLRKQHRLAHTEALWLGDRGKGLSYDGLYSTLQFRAERANLTGFHPHLLRHTAASRWLAAGGSEGGLMAVAGWTRPDMLHRYVRASASQRAAEEAGRLNLGDL